MQNEETNIEKAFDFLFESGLQKENDDTLEKGNRPRITKKNNPDYIHIKKNGRWFWIKREEHEAVQEGKKHIDDVKTHASRHAEDNSFQPKPGMKIQTKDGSTFELTGEMKLYPPNAPPEKQYVEARGHDENGKPKWIRTDRAKVVSEPEKSEKDEQKQEKETKEKKTPKENKQEDKEQKVEKQPKQEEPKEDKEGGLKPETIKSEDTLTDEEKEDIEDKWKGYEMDVKRLALGRAKSVFAFGKGGVGKTFRATKILDSMTDPKTGEKLDYKTFTGGASVAGLVKMLRENSDKLLVFDDFDDVLKDPDALDILKNALDTSGDNTISYRDPETGDMQSFKFTGKVLFISNMNPDKLPEKKLNDFNAILTRTGGGTNLSMTNEQTMYLIKKDIKPNLKIKNADGSQIKYSEKEVDSAIDFCDKWRNTLPDLSVRTIGKVLAIRRDAEKNGKDPDEVCEAMLLPGKQDSLDVVNRFDSLKDMVGIVAKGDVKSLIAYGSGGIGKTYNVTSKFEEMGMKKINASNYIEDPETKERVYLDDDGEPIDPSKGYVVMNNIRSASQLYDSLYLFRNHTILFDDTDAVLLDPQAQNFLKGALDSSGSGQVNKITSKKPPKESDDPDKPKKFQAPQEFEFKGRCVFITNLPSDKLAQPLQSRAITVNAAVKPDEAVPLLSHIKDQKKKSAEGKKVKNDDRVTNKDLDDLMNLISDAYDEHGADKLKVGVLTGRVFDTFAGKMMDLKEEYPDDWERKMKKQLLKSFMSLEVFKSMFILEKGYALTDDFFQVEYERFYDVSESSHSSE